MDIFMGILGLFGGWLVTHYYYKRQMKEQVNPLPQIRGVHNAVLELYGLSLQRQDDELQRGIRTLVIEMLHTRNRVMNALVPASFTLGFVTDLYKVEDEELERKLKELEPSVQTALKRLSQVSHEYDGLIEAAEKITGMKVADMFTYEEVIKILQDPRSSKRAIE